MRTSHVVEVVRRGRCHGHTSGVAETSWDQPLTADRRHIS